MNTLTLFNFTAVWRLGCDWVGGGESNSVEWVRDGFNFVQSEQTVEFKACQLEFHVDWLYTTDLYWWHRIGLISTSRLTGKLCLKWLISANVSVVDRGGLGGKWLCSDSSSVVCWPSSHLTLPDCRCTSTRGQSAVQLQLNVTLPDCSPESCRWPDEGCWCKSADSLHQLGLIRLQRMINDKINETFI